MEMYILFSINPCVYKSYTKKKYFKNSFYKIENLMTKVIDINIKKFVKIKNPKSKN